MLCASFLDSSSDGIVAKNIIVFIDDIGQLKSVDTTYRSTVREIDSYENKHERFVGSAKWFTWWNSYAYINKSVQYWTILFSNRC